MAKSISRYLADISSTSGVLDGTLSTAAQTNITSLGTLSSLTVSGSAAMTLTTAAQPNITSVGTLSSLTVSGNIGGTLTTAAQPNITSVGTLTGLDIGANSHTGADPAFGISIDVNDYVAQFANTRSTAGQAYGVRILAGTNSSDSSFYVRNKANDTDYFIVKGDGKVGIRIANPGSFNAAGNDLVVGAGTSGDNNGITIYTNADSTGHLLFADGTSGTDGYTGYIGYTHASNYMSFHTNAGVERMRIDTSGLVGIGTNDPSGYHTNGNKLVVAGSGNTGITIATTDDDYGSVFFAKNTTGNGAYRGWIQYGQSAVSDANFRDVITFGAAASEQMRIAPGKVGISTDFSGGNASSVMTAPLNIKLTSGSTAPIVTLNLEHSNNTSLVEQRIQFNIGDDGTADSYVNAGYIAVGKANAYVTDDTRDSYLSFATAENAVQSEKMRIDSNGTIRIGAHAQLSHPNTYSYQTLKVQNSGSASNAIIDIHVSDGTKVGTFYGETGHNQGFLTSTYGWAFKVDNSGNIFPVGYLGLAAATNMGNSCEMSHPGTSAWQTLKIRNNDDSSQCAIELHSSQDTKRCIVYGAVDYYGFLTQSAGWSWKGDASGNWTATGTVTQNSDIRLKENINTIPNALEKVTKLRGVEYTRISTQEKEIGVIAQEVKEVVPELVTITSGKTDADPDGLEDLHAMKYQNTVALLIEAIKELKAEVDELKGNK